MPHQDPDMAEELALYARGFRLVAGLDEVGRGALAGDVVAGAVILPADAGVLARLRGVRDSKQLSPRQRRKLSETIQAEALAIGLGRVSAQDIDRLGIAPASRQAMMLAVAGLCTQPDFLLIDAFRLPDLALPQKAIIKGDASCLSIAAASIVAKVWRDARMIELDAVYPGYGFGQHKGYGTAFHCQALRLLRPCSIHRLSFAPVRSASLGGDAEEQA
jgi:ribonuclease HII